MSIRLRKIQKTDLIYLEFCVKQKIIPVAPFWTDDFTAEDLLQDYMNYDFYNSFVYVIEDETHPFIGIIDSYLIDDTLLVSYYVLQSMQGNGYCSKGMLELLCLMRDVKHIRKIQLKISNTNLPSIRVAKKAGFKLKNITEESQDWEFSLRKNKR